VDATGNKDDVLDRLTQAYDEMSPQLRKAAQFVLEHPNDIAVKSIHEVADAAEVHPNTLVRMANAVGFNGYRTFRRPFSEHLRQGGDSFQDRARWLQSIAESGRLGGLYSEIAATALSNVEQLFSGTTADELKAAADLIVRCRRVYVLGVGTGYALAHNFWYVTRMAFDHVIQVPRAGTLPIDDLARIGPRDVLLAMTFQPFRTDVIEAVDRARDAGASLIALSDSRTSPIIAGAVHAFVAPTSSPQFFTSLVAVQAYLEALIAFMIADADRSIVRNIEEFHQLRYESGVYQDDAG
jgi:DNA-binding MurR/RpiR family transcriptional regulator